MGGNSNNYDYYTQMYENEMRIISEYNNTQEKFAERLITKEQFLQDIKNPKEFMKIMNLN